MIKKILQSLIKIFLFPVVILGILWWKWISRESTNFGGIKRSPEWRRVRNEHIKRNPKCAVTGSTKRCEVHHILPFHLYPEHELDPNNLITLRRDMHFIFAHLMSYHSWNPNIVEDAKVMREKILSRP